MSVAGSSELGVSSACMQSAHPTFQIPVQAMKVVGKDRHDSTAGPASLITPAGPCAGHEERRGGVLAHHGHCWALRRTAPRGGLYLQAPGEWGPGPAALGTSKCPTRGVAVICRQNDAFCAAASCAGGLHACMWPVPWVSSPLSLGLAFTCKRHVTGLHGRQVEHLQSIGCVNSLSYNMVQ